MDMDLISALESNAKSKRKFIIYQVLQALKYLHSQNAIHCRINPQKILLDKSTWHVAITGFGLALSLNEKLPNDNVLIYEDARWYQPPEVFFDSPKPFTTGLDMWGVGLLLGELILEMPVFPGNSSSDQVYRVAKLLGKPSKDDLARLKPR